MPVVAIVVDSAANLPTDLAKELGVEVVPMYLKFGDGVFRDGIDLAPRDFYARLVKEHEPASTSTPSAGDFLEAFARTEQREIVCVTVSAGVSAAHQQARLAAEAFEGRVEVVDSTAAAMAEGWVALEAARAAIQGDPMESVAARAREVAARVVLLATIDTFEFLQRSGRVNRFQAYAATVLDIKPVFSMWRGQIEPVARPRTRRRALDRVVEEALANIAGRPVHLATFHADAEGDALTIADAVAARANVVERILTEATPVIGAHTGPGLAGAALFCE